jgi:polar amino acid transport system permease protein
MGVGVSQQAPASAGAWSEEVGVVEALEKPRVHRRGVWEYAAWGLCLVVVAGVGHTLVTNEHYQWGVVARYFTASTVLRGLVMTLVLTGLAMLFGTVLALFIAILRISRVRPLRLLASGYITFFRGTPVLVQLIFWFNIAALYPNISIGIPLTGISQGVDVNRLMSATTAAIIGLSLNEAAYLAEIIRGGFASVDKGQLEAADSLGMSGRTKLWRIIIPQSMPTVIPATGNQVIGMFKETSLVSVLGVAELLQSVQLIYARTYQTIPLLIVACLWYLAMTLALSYPQSLIEKKYSRTKSRVATGHGLVADVPIQATLGATLGGEAR